MATSEEIFRDAMALPPDARAELTERLVESLAQDLAFYREQGLIQGEVRLDQLVDHSFVDAALRELGPYKR